jgi:hypothetical protein
MCRSIVIIFGCASTVLYHDYCNCNFTLHRYPIETKAVFRVNASIFVSRFFSSLTLPLARSLSQVQNCIPIFAFYCTCAFALCLPAVEVLLFSLTQSSRFRLPSDLLEAEVVDECESSEELDR